MLLIVNFLYKTDKSSICSTTFHSLLVHSSLTLGNMRPILNLNLLSSYNINTFSISIVDLAAIRLIKFKSDDEESCYYAKSEKIISVLSCNILSEVFFIS